MSDKGNATYTANIKAVGKGDSGEFTSIVSVFGNVDLTSDIVVAGAYKNNIEAWAKSEDSLPVIWSHQWQDPAYNIGFVKEMEELDARDPRLKGEAFDTGGLLVVGQIDLDDDPSVSKARQVWKLVKGARVRNWSFHYAVEQASMGAKNGERVRFLEQLAITEVGPTHLGANPATHTVEAKAVAETLGLTAEELEVVRGIISKQAPVVEPVSDETHAIDPRLEEERYLRFL